jgi:phage terminase large subunit GpA-like protein
MLESIGLDWVDERIEALTDTKEVLTVSEWAERVRYLPPPNRFPGPFRWNVTPFMEEIADCLSAESPVREVSLMKGVQTSGTVAVLENAIGYYIDHVKSASVMMVTADRELAQLRMDQNVVPMLQASDLEHLIQSGDETNKRKAGRTSQKMEWLGGGFLIPLGAQNANKMRSIPIQILLRDEVDGWPDVVGKDGDPMQLTMDRTTSYAETRKVLDISTPLIKGSSKIERRFLRGDQRRYHVRCKHCGHHQPLRWRWLNKETGELRGIIWETEEGQLVRDSVRWLCAECGGEHWNEDKITLFDPANGAAWVPTAKAVNEFTRSYHLSGLYSPPGFLSWADQVQLWLESYDDTAGRPIDTGKMQVFYNNVLGKTWEIYGEKIKFSTVSAHRRDFYALGEIPNNWAQVHCDSAAMILTAAVDVQGDYLAVAVFGWTRGQRAILVDYWHWEGDPSQTDDPNTWGRMRDMVENKEYIADDGRRYRVAITLIDSSWGELVDQVYSVASEYAASVYPIKGRQLPIRGARHSEFAPFTTTMGTKAFHVTVDLYKERWAARLRRPWDGMSRQPDGHFNAPADLPDKMLEELTKETKQPRKDSSGKTVGYEWFRPQGARNELWDLLVYNNAALEMVMWDVCTGQLGLEYVNPEAFWEIAETEKLFFDGG